MSYKGRAGARFVRRAGLFALVLAAALCAARTQGETQAGVCRAAGRTLACPEGFAPAADISDEHFAYMRHGRHDQAVFVASPAAPSDAKAFEEGLAAEVASRLFPPGTRGYRWKRMEAPPKLSRHETGAGAAQAFDGARRVFVEYHRLSLSGRDLYVGHAFAPGGPGGAAEAARLFALGGEAGSVVTECAVQDLVGALTGEEVDPADTLCAVMVRPGRDPRRQPGTDPKPPCGKVVRPPGR
jgi:hypothetical protein